ncbi:MAG: DNA translocase FtsK, partial [Prevotella sp.]|nr:DNA translocase FtsK [Prevotella sp.]
EARVANIIEYNKRAAEKLAPIVVVIDEFADLSDQLESKKEKDAFFKPVQRIAQTGRSRGIHLVICTQRPEAKLVPPTTKAQLNGRVALRVNDGISSRMIIEGPEAQYLQKHGDMIYHNSDTTERAQGYLIEIQELDEIVQNVIEQNK